MLYFFTHDSSGPPFTAISCHGNSVISAELRFAALLAWRQSSTHSATERSLKPAHLHSQRPLKIQSSLFSPSKPTAVLKKLKRSKRGIECTWRRTRSGFVVGCFAHWWVSYIAQTSSGGFKDIDRGVRDALWLLQSADLLWYRPGFIMVFRRSAR